MSSPITFSGFNNIDFNVVLNSMMQQASAPLTALRAQQSSLQTRVGNLNTLTSQLSSVQSAAATLASASSLASFAVASTDATAVNASVGGSAVAGHYDVVVQELARAQVTASTSTAPDANTTAVATGGQLTINGTAVTVSGSATLQQLASTINGTSGVGVTASVVQASAGAYRLVLTATAAGSASAFTVTNGLTGGSGVTFGDANANGVSGDSAADNAVQATDASVLVNNVQVTSSSNTLDSVIPGTTLTLYKKDPATTIGIDISSDSSALHSALSGFVSAYNNLVSFYNTQANAAAGGDQASLGRDPLLRQLRNSLQTALNSSYSNGSSFQYLSQIGLEFTRSGTLQLNESQFASAVQSGAADATRLAAGLNGTDGAFGAINSLLTTYTQASGILPSAQQQAVDQISRYDSQIADMQTRLAAQRSALQAEFIAADAAMTQLNSQSGALTNYASSLTASTNTSGL